MLAARNLTISIGRTTPVRDSSLAIAPGEVVGLLGENGAGKSTLLKALAGDLAPERGSVDLDGRRLQGYPPVARARRRAVLPQHGAVAFGFTALELVLMGRYPHCGAAPGPCDVAIARDALAAADGAHLEQRIATTLSGGEAARVQLARALAQIWEPVGEGSRYLLLDEPTASLDPQHQHAALRLVCEFARAGGVGVLAVLHDVNLAGRYADRVVLLKGGTVLDQGSPQAMFTPERLRACYGVETVVLTHPRLAVPVVAVAA